MCNNQCMTCYHVVLTCTDTVEEMASPSQEINLTTSIQFAAYDHTESTADCIAMATVRAPLYEPQSRSAVDIVAVIDRSGSMSGIKLDLVRKTLLFVIDQCKSMCMVVRPHVLPHTSP